MNIDYTSTRRQLFALFLALGCAASALAHEKGFVLKHPVGGASGLWADPEILENSISVIAGTSVQVLDEEVIYGSSKWRKVKVIEGERKGKIGWVPIDHIASE